MSPGESWAGLSESWHFFCVSFSLPKRFLPNLLILTKLAAKVWWIVEIARLCASSRLPGQARSPLQPRSATTSTRRRLCWCARCRLARATARHSAEAVVCADRSARPMKITIVIDSAGTTKDFTLVDDRTAKNVYVGRTRTTFRRHIDPKTQEIVEPLGDFQRRVQGEVTDGLKQERTPARPAGVQERVTKSPPRKMRGGGGAKTAGTQPPPNSPKISRVNSAGDRRWAGLPPEANFPDLPPPGPKRGWQLPPPTRSAPAGPPGPWAKPPDAPAYLRIPAHARILSGASTSRVGKGMDGRARAHKRPACRRGAAAHPRPARPCCW